LIGVIDDLGLPVLSLELDEQTWPAVIDTGFNGDVELPADLRQAFDTIALGVIDSQLAGGVTTTEECYYLEFPFDGEFRPVQATFVDSHRILIGTRLIRDYRLTIDFPARTLLLERVDPE
jgi:hypothetical protein